MTYKILEDQNLIIKIEANGAETHIPLDRPSSFLDEYLKWVKQGNTAEPVQPTPPPNWEAFNITLLTNPLWISWGLNPDLRTAIISASTTSNLAALQSAYNIAKVLTPKPPVGAIKEWQDIADDNHIGIIF